MKKSEMDKLRKLAQDLYHDDSDARLVDASEWLDDLLDTFEVDPPTARETIEKNGMTVTPHEPEEAFVQVRPGVFVAKENTSIFTKEADNLLERMQTPENKEAIKKAFDTMGESVEDKHE